MDSRIIESFSVNGRLYKKVEYLDEEEYFWYGEVCIRPVTRIEYTEDDLPIPESYYEEVKKRGKFASN